MCSEGARCSYSSRRLPLLWWETKLPLWCRVPLEESPRLLPRMNKRTNLDRRRTLVDYDFSWCTPSVRNGQQSHSFKHLFLDTHFSAWSPLQLWAAAVQNQGWLTGFLSSHRGCVTSFGPFNQKYLSRRRLGTLSLVVLFGTQGALVWGLACGQAGILHL